MSKLGVMRIDDPLAVITGAGFQDWKYNKKIFDPKPKYVRMDRECLGENIARGREEDFIISPNPLE